MEELVGVELLVEEELVFEGVGEGLGEGLGVGLGDGVGEGLGEGVGAGLGVCFKPILTLFETLFLLSVRVNFVKKFLPKTTDAPSQIPPLAKIPTSPVVMVKAEKICFELVLFRYM